MRQENPDAPFGELSRLIGLKWKALDPEEKKSYEDRAKVSFFRTFKFSTLFRLKWPKRQKFSKPSKKKRRNERRNLKWRLSQLVQIQIKVIFDF